MGELVIVIAVVALVVVWVRKRKRRARETLDLTLAVVGFEASGKTVFIGSMFNELRVPDASGVFLDTTPENAGKLLALYNTTADTDKEFPNSTNKGELIEWPFTVKVKSAASVTDIGNFSYLDFAGESCPFRGEGVAASLVRGGLARRCGRSHVHSVGYSR